MIKGLDIRVELQARGHGPSPNKTSAQGVRKAEACRKVMLYEHEEGAPTSEPLSRSVTKWLGHRRCRPLGDRHLLCGLSCTYVM